MLTVDVVTVTDANGNIKITKTDPCGNLRMVIQYLDSEPCTTEYCYDERGNLTKVIDARENETVYEYDFLSRKTNSQSPDKGTTQFIYDRNNNLRFVQDANHVASVDDWVYYKYDRLGRLIEVGELNDVDSSTVVANINILSYPTTGNWRIRNFYDTTYTYNGGENWYPPSDFWGTEPNVKGRLSLSAYRSGDSGEPDWVEAYEYDSRGRNVHKGVRMAMGGVPQWYEIRYGYDSAGNLTSIIYPDETTVSYSYDERNLLQDVTDGGAITYANFAYNITGLDSVISFGNGVLTKYT